MGSLKKFRNTLALSIPENLGRVTYKAAYDCLSKTLELTHPAVSLHIRNSFLNNSFTPFISDLDTSLVFPDNYTQSSTVSALKIIKRFKIFFPIFAEQNSYSASELDEYSHFINYFDIQRDPYLKEKITRDLDLQEKFYFMLRLYRSDFKNLMENPSIREKKWEIHFQQIGRNYRTPIQLETLLEDILLMVFSLQDTEIHKTNLLNYFQAEYKGLVIEDHLLSPSLIALFPHLVAHRKAAKIEPWMKNFIEAQLKMEVWGMVSQWRQTLIDPDLKEGFVKHLNNLIQKFPDFKHVVEFEKILHKIQSA